MSVNEEKFKLEIVRNNLIACLQDEDDVKLKEYLLSYEELDKFFYLMGSVFGFVSNDLRAKMDILYEFLKDESKAQHFSTVKTMIAYEMDNNLLKQNDYVSGSRTLLRLHRGLDFIRLFLKRISELKDTDNTAQVCKDSYEETLAKYHTWIIKTGARVAMQYAMPNRNDLLKKVCGNSDEEIWHTLEMLPETLDMTSKVYERIDNLYTKNDLHSLP